MTYIATRTERCKLYAKEWGPAGGHPIILVHGWPLNADSWDDVALGLAAAGYRTIAYDRRGFGRSDQPWDGYDYDSLADDLAEVIDQCAEGGKVSLAGFSMGGGEIARYLSRKGSGRVERVALIASVVPLVARRDDNSDGVPQAKFDEIRAQIVEDRFAFLQTFAKQFYGVGILSKPVSQGVLDAAFAMAVQAGLWPTLAAMDAWSTTDFRPDCAAFDVPTLILHGTADANVPIDTAGRQAARLIRHARFIEYDGAAHGILTTHKDAVTRDLLDFLRDAAPGAESSQALFGGDQETSSAIGAAQPSRTLQPGL